MNSKAKIAIGVLAGATAGAAITAATIVVTKIVKIVLSEIKNDENGCSFTSPDGNNTVHKFLKPGSWYSIPYRSLVTNEIDNLIVAGRCISATQEACSSTRLTPIVMALGQAAGTAAAQSVRTGEKANALNTDVLRAQLLKDGAFLDEYHG